jgi:uncharacterized membrane protein
LTQPPSQPTAAPAPEATLFEAVLMPHRSLSLRGLGWVLGFLGVVSLGVTTLFFTLGAWPIAGFNGGEMLLATVLLRAHVRSRREREVLLLSESGMRVLSFDQNGGKRERHLPGGWLNVVVEERQGRVPGLVLTTHGRRLEVARMLGEAEKRDLADALRGVLHRMRNPVFNNPQLSGSGE